MKRSGLCLLTFLLLLLVSPAQAQTFYSAPSAAWSQNGFGGALAIGGDAVFVGEPQNIYTPGIVFVYQHDGAGMWKEAATLKASDAVLGDQFGQALAIDGTTLLVGAGNQHAGKGTAYVFTKEGSGAWKQTAMLAAGDGTVGDNLGSTVALHGDVALVGAAAHNDKTGAVYVFRREGTTWAAESKLVGSDLDSKDQFGYSLAVYGDWALVGAPRHNSNAGAVYAFQYNAAAGTWNEKAKLTGSTVEAGGFFGSAMSLGDGMVFVGAPRHNNATGAVFAFRYDAQTGVWKEAGILTTNEGEPRDFFGASMAFDGTRVLIGAPGRSSLQGVSYLFEHNHKTGAWTEASMLSADNLNNRDLFSGTVALHGNVAAVGLLGTDFGAGSAMIFSMEDNQRQWVAQADLKSTAKGLDAVTGGQIDCAEGTASVFDCKSVDLVSFLPVHEVGGGRGVQLSDLWGWTDPETGKEYAIVGRLDGTSFIDLSDPLNPVYLGNLSLTEGANPSVWRDMKVYKNHAFIVADGAGAHGMQVFDLTQLRDVKNPPVDFEETVHYDKIHSAHNIVINEDTGFAYSVGSSSGGETCGGGLHIINIQDPKNPTFVGCFADPTTGRASTGYSHDAQCVVYRGPDAEHQGKEICFGANETALSIADVTDKANPVALSAASYPNVGYAHQGWLTEDHRYFFLDDELDEIQGSVPGTRTLIWDVTDLDDPQLIKEHISEVKSSDHNLYIRGHYMYQSNYQSGLRILDIQDVANPVEVGFFDTVPLTENTVGMDGSWSNYPFFKSGVIVVTSGSEGVFILKKRDIDI